MTNLEWRTILHSTISQLKIGKKCFRKKWAFSRLFGHAKYTYIYEYIYSYVPVWYDSKSLLTGNLNLRSSPGFLQKMMRYFSSFSKSGKKSSVDVVCCKMKKSHYNWILQIITIIRFLPLFLGWPTPARAFFKEELYISFLFSKCCSKFSAEKVWWEDRQYGLLRFLV